MLVAIMTMVLTLIVEMIYAVRIEEHAIGVILERERSASESLMILYEGGFFPLRITAFIE